MSFLAKPKFLILAIMIALFSGVFYFGNVFAESSCDASLEGKTDAELQQILEECEREIAEQTAQLKEVQKEATNLESGIQELDYKISKSTTAIKAHNVKITQLKKEIAQRSLEIDNLSTTMDRVRRSLADLIQETNELDNRTIVEALLSSKDLAEFFVDVDSFNILKENLNNQLSELKRIKEETRLAQEKLQVSQKGEEEQRFLVEKQKKQTESYKGEQQRILNEVKVEEKEYKTVIAEKEAKKRAILSRILNIGGNEITFGDALKLIQPYEAQMGVDASLVLAVLTQESGVNGVIGSNLGKCNYNTPWKNNSGTVMSDSQKDAFLTIMTELGMDPNKAPVSCPIPTDGSYGGAMGPSQFMPNTWMGFRNRIASVVGVAHASPFVNEHAFVGTMLYLSDAMKRCKTAFSDKFTLNACAAAKYYTGLAATGSRLSRHMNPTSSYGYRVAKRAAGYEDDIQYLSL